MGRPLRSRSAAAAPRDANAGHSGPEAWDVGRGLAGHVWRTAAPQGVVLLQAGWGDYAERWVEGFGGLVPRLVAAGFTVYAFDMWGSGRSPGRRGQTDVRGAVRDHLAARRRLAAEGIGQGSGLPLFLLGHSLGGLVTATSVVKRPDGVAGVVLLSPAIKYDVGAPARLLAGALGVLAPTLPFPSAEQPPDVLTTVPAAQQALKDDPVLHTRGMTWRTAGGGATVSHANWRRYPAVTVPVLAVHGDADIGTDPSGSVDLIATIGSVDKELYLVPDGRHSILDDADGARTAEHVIDWLVTRAAPWRRGRAIADAAHPDNDDWPTRRC